ncbi:MAG: 3'(2'),5'-bisphosphate nucleotidase CysQ [Rubrivivax sp.]|nr:3'(2'),5'-bisphosphate nucleotidase CysQ [Rubrivivax sp.]MDP3226280.1 3'(2'),5'-bisphosphate nucleotidase CysQ [Rubrivivax sp.]
MKLNAELLPAVERIAREAGVLILQVYASDFDVQGKADTSPVTEADERAEACIVAALRRLTPEVPIVAEEAAARGEVPEPGSRFWLVDPLDGTREFVSRNGEFTVNIALIEDGEPVLGVVFEPVADRLYAGVVGAGAWLHEAAGRRAMHCRQPAPEGVVLACSRSHGDEAAMARWLGSRPVLRRMAVGSSLKFGLLAAGQADLYPRLGRTKEWDTAAGHAVLRAAGGQVFDLQGNPLRYGKPGFENPHFVAHGLTSSAL